MDYSMRLSDLFRTGLHECFSPRTLNLTESIRSKESALQNPHNALAALADITSHNAFASAKLSAIPGDHELGREIQ
jgi:hypothetical protein